MTKNRRFKSTGAGIGVLAAVAAMSYAALGIVSIGSDGLSKGMPPSSVFALMLGFFLLSFAISVAAAVTGIGGGVLFTPVMLAFTPVNSLIVRATGLVIAMFTGLASTGCVMKKGLGNIRMCIPFAGAYGAGAFAGALGAVYAWEHFGETGEAFIRIALGLIIFGVAAYFLFGGKKIEWPEVVNTDRFTERLKMPLPYYEESLNRVVEYRLKKAGQGIAAIFFVGVVAGFFGLGGGWAVVSVQNLVIGAPIKVAAANSLVLLGMGDCIAIWPYVLTGAVIPLFAAPWLAGAVLGGKAGSALLVNMRAGATRSFLTGILVFTGFSLVARGLDILNVIRTPGWINGVVFIMTALFVFRSVLSGKNESSKGRDGT